MQNEWFGMIMHGVESTVYILLAACLLPYLFTAIAKIFAGFNLKDNQNPREFLAKTTGVAARANAAQQNSFESLPLFVAAVLMAEYMVVPDYIISLLSGAYLLLRVAYGICYLANWSSLRTIIWLLSMACPITLLIIVMRLG